MDVHDETPFEQSIADTYMVLTAQSASSSYQEGAVVQFSESVGHGYNYNDHNEKTSQRKNELFSIIEKQRLQKVESIPFDLLKFVEVSVLLATILFKLPLNGYHATNPSHNSSELSQFVAAFVP